MNKIDTLTSVEIAGGDRATNNEIDHDGVELLINGSDLEEDFPDDDQDGRCSVGRQSRDVEPSELSSSEEGDKYDDDAVAKRR